MTDDDARLKLTLTAFYGEKPRQLAELIAFCQGRVSAHVPNGFEPYEPAQVHATIIGFEGRWIDGRLHNDNLLQRGERRCMDIENALRFLQATNMLPFQARIGGFHADEDFGFESFGRHPYERSFEIQASNAVVAMGWPVAGSTFTNALDDLRRELLRGGIVERLGRLIEVTGETGGEERGVGHGGIASQRPVRHRRPVECRRIEFLEAAGVLREVEVFAGEGDGVLTEAGAARDIAEEPTRTLRRKYSEGFIVRCLR